jgi:hypothetical protein
VAFEFAKLSRSAQRAAFAHMSKSDKAKSAASTANASPVKSRSGGGKSLGSGHRQKALAANQQRSPGSTPTVSHPVLYHTTRASEAISSPPGMSPARVPARTTWTR